jgi:hypothetical protein
MQAVTLVQIDLANLPLQDLRKMHYDMPPLSGH